MDWCQRRYSGGETMTTLRYVFALLLLLGGASVKAQVAPPSGAWLQTKLVWKMPPPELELKERYAEAEVLYFSPDHKLVVLYATVIQGAKSEVISGGDGQVVYLGTWGLNGNSLHVEYRLVSRTVAKVGETLPGPVLSQDIRSVGVTLLFMKDRFKRDEKLDNELKVILHRESARQGGLGKGTDKQ
jgi:hypothetical protein